jgi:hypothetical protein
MNKQEEKLAVYSKGVDGIIDAFPAPADATARDILDVISIQKKHIGHIGRYHRNGELGTDPGEFALELALPVTEHKQWWKGVTSYAYKITDPLLEAAVIRTLHEIGLKANEALKPVAKYHVEKNWHVLHKEHCEALGYFKRLEWRIESVEHAYETLCSLLSGVTYSDRETLRRYSKSLRLYMLAKADLERLDNAHRLLVAFIEESYIT